MKAKEIVEPSDKEVAVMLHILKRRPKPEKKKEPKSPRHSFIDMFGGMAGYDSPDTAGSVSPDTN